MVCSFCAQGIEKKFNQHPSINTVNVNLEQSRVRLIVKPTKKFMITKSLRLYRMQGIRLVKLNDNEINI